jgi:hypothetical protein
MYIEKIFHKAGVLILFFLPAFAWAQTDYVIQLSGDTLKGSLKILDYQQVDQVQIKTDKEKKSLTALQVRALRKNNVLYRPVRYDNTVRFMKVLIDGYLSLNAFNQANQSLWDGRYLTKMDGTGLEVPNLTFKKLLGTFLSDCGDIKKRIEDGDLGRGDLEKIIDLYNACMQTNSVVNSKAVATANIESEKVLAVKNLLTKVEAENFATKKDALDIIKDIQSKVNKNEAVPNYLLDGLKSSLANTPSLTKELDTVVALLKK